MSYGGVTAPSTSAPAPTTGGYSGVKAPPTPAPAPKPIVAPAPSPTASNFPGLGGAPVASPSQNGTLKTTPVFSQNSIADNNQQAEAFMSPAPIAVSSFQSAVDGVTKIMQGGTPLEGLQAGAQVEAGVAGVAFSFMAPVLNIINAAIGVAAQGGAKIPLIQQTASDMNLNPAYGQQVGSTLGLLSNLGGVAMGILGAKPGEAIPKDVTPEQLQEVIKNPEVMQATKDVIEAHNALPPEAKAVVNAHIEKVAQTPAEAHAAYAKSQGYEPITPDSQLPTIDMGAKPKPDVPIIQTEPRKGPDLPGYTVEPLKTASPAPAEAAATSVEKPTPAAPSEVQPPAAEKPPVTIDRPIAADGTRVAKAANDINEALVKQGLSELPQEQMAKYTSGSYKDSVAQADILANTDRAALNKMAITGEDIPKGVHPQILFNAVEKLATKEGDTALLQELAKSPLTTQLSEAGGTLGSHGFNDNPNSAVRAIREVEKAWTTNVTKRGATIARDTASRIKDSIRATNTVKTWSDFVASIEC